jgi:hypothetical protein
LGHELFERFRENPFDPPPLVKTYLATTKARSEVIGGVLALAGIHGFSYTEFDQIAAHMQPDEIHPEVVEKLYFIQVAFGL